LPIKEPTLKPYLRKLYHGYYVDRIEYPTYGFGRNPAIYKLDKMGVQLLERLGYRDISIPNQKHQIPHTLGLADIRISITQHIKAMGWNLLQWKSEYDFHREYHKVRLPNYKQSVSLKPDGYFVVELPNKRVSTFFLEFDRDTENLGTFIKKVRCYIEFLKSQQYSKIYGYPGFRVLTVVEDKARRRLQNLIHEIAKVERIKRRFWLTHLDDINAENPINHPIWNIAGNIEGAQLFED